MKYEYLFEKIPEQRFDGLGSKLAHEYKSTEKLAEPVYQTATVLMEETEGLNERNLGHISDLLMEKSLECLVNGGTKNHIINRCVSMLKPTDLRSEVSSSEVFSVIDIHNTFDDGKEKYDTMDIYNAISKRLNVQ